MAASDGLEEKLNALFSSPESMAQIKKLAEGLSGRQPSGENAGAEGAGAESGDGFFPGVDPALTKLLTAAMREYGTPSDAARIIAALRPYLSSERAARLDKAMNIARMARTAKKLLPELGGGHV